MLRFHILNVGQGDSIVVESDNVGEKSFGVIDSNAISGQTPKALDKLKELGAKNLSFICMTHPHRDHYRGLSHILEHYAGKIDQFLMFPAGDYIGANVKKLAKKYRKIIASQDDPSITLDATEFIKILMLAQKTTDMQECTGPYNNIAVNGFIDTNIHCILPFRKFKGIYLERISNDDPTIFESENENNLSVALQFRHKGVSVILGGDATHKNWSERLNWEKGDRRLDSVHSHAVKMPHHGSEKDCSKEMLDVAYSAENFSKDNEIDDEVDNENKRYAFISANGVKHPSESVLRELERRGILPYCTNLHKSCGANIHQLINVIGIEPVLGKYLNQLSSDESYMSCQGDITFTINDDGTCNLDREANVPCGFRGEFKGLFAGLI